MSLFLELFHTFSHKNLILESPADDCKWTKMKGLHTYFFYVFSWEARL